MKQINSLVYEASTSNRYATFFYAQFEPNTRKLTCVNAGHNPPFVLRPNSDESLAIKRDGVYENPNNFEVLRLEEGGAVIGMLPSMLVNYTQGEIDLQARFARRVQGWNLGGNESSRRRMERRRDARTVEDCL
jgi:sigma-B regulation protein RsbU (phosphoserine phosphatase)